MLHTRALYPLERDVVFSGGHSVARSFGTFRCVPAVSTYPDVICYAPTRVSGVESAGGVLTAARAEQLRAMEAAAELTGAKAKGSGEKGEINIPGVGKTMGSGGVKTKPQGIMVSCGGWHWRDM